MTAPASPAGVVGPVVDLVADLGELSWELARTASAAAASPTELAQLAPDWLPAQVPDTAAGALAAAGRWDGVSPLDTDADDWWWRVRLPPSLGGQATLEAAGIATVSEVWLGDRQLATSDAMFTRFVVDVQIPAGGAELFIACRALAPLLAARHPRPQWKTRLVRQQNLRWFRTTLLGRMPGWSPIAAPVGPWRTLRLFGADSTRIAGRRVAARCAADGSGAFDGTVEVDVTVDTPAVPGLAALHVSGPAGDDIVGSLTVDVVPDAAAGRSRVRVHGSVTAPAVQRWWPHGFGPQPLYGLRIELDGRPFELGRVGFREFVVDRTDGAFRPLVNGVPVFLRGACWVPPGGVALSASDEEVRAAVRSACDAGLLMLRVTGTTVYESVAFWDACDEYGLLVWQDAMIANLPPPDAPEFVASLTAELTQVLGDISGRPSHAIVSGGSEVQQQAAMLGLPPERRALPVLEETIPRLVAATTPAATYVVSSPTGGEPPFRPDQGVAHYFGVGAYLRPLEDARRTGVRFAAECLAFANPPEMATVEEAFGSAAAAGHTPEWKRGVARDAGAPWDFEDVRDVYTEMLFGVDVRRLRFTDPDRALDLGRAAVAEVMRRTMGEWRRADSGCGGALILNLTDLVPGAGWGIRDSYGRPKSAWYALRQVCAPLAVHIVDESMSGLGIRMWNDSPADLPASIKVTLFADGQTPVGSGSREVVLPARGEARCEVENVLGAFRDAGWNYRFGPPSADVVRAVLRTADGREVSDVYLPAGNVRPMEHDIGLSAELAEAEQDTDVEQDTATVIVTTRRLAQFVAFDVTGWIPEDAWFHLAPGESRTVRLHRDSGGGRLRGEVRALNSTTRATLLKDPRTG